MVHKGCDRGIGREQSTEGGRFCPWGGGVRMGGEKQLDSEQRVFPIMLPLCSESFYRLTLITLLLAEQQIGTLSIANDVTDKT